jgi:hypothetical protein
MKAEINIMVGKFFFTDANVIIYFKKQLQKSLYIFHIRKTELISTQNKRDIPPVA